MASPWSSSSSASSLRWPLGAAGHNCMSWEAVYGDDGWLFLEEDSYRVVQETLFEKQEHEEQLQLQQQEEEEEEQEEEEPQVPCFLLSSLDDHIALMLPSF
uniref:WIYLD domain-containing protein n=1 Tax=Leersia perrieri TaxID=77586 RepID=A0A0D9WXY7_9ORYZ